MKLGNLIKRLETGVSVNSENRPKTNNEYGILKTSSVTYGTFKPEENKRIINAELGRARIKPKKDSIIVSRMNTAQLVGASAYIERDYDNLYLPDRLWQASETTAGFSMKYLALVLASVSFRRSLTGVSSGTSGSMKNISKSAFLALELPLPPIEIQKQLVEEFAEEQETIVANKNLIGIYEQKIKLRIAEVWDE